MNWNVKRTKINKKSPRLAHLKKVFNVTRKPKVTLYVAVRPGQVVMGGDFPD